MQVVEPEVPSPHSYSQLQPIGDELAHPSLPRHILLQVPRQPLSSDAALASSKLRPKIKTQPSRRTERLVLALKASFFLSLGRFR